MKFPSKEIVEYIKEAYVPGTRIELISMNDPYRDLPEGLKGTVSFVDDIGTIHVDWDNGSTLGLAYGEDRCKVIGEDE